MKQIFAVGSLTGSDAISVRASSLGMPADILTGLLPIATYQSQSLDSDYKPIRLSLVRTPATGRVLSHVTPGDGSYVSHLVLDVPATTDAQTAIQTWDSPHWQRTAGEAKEAKSDLPDLPFLPVSDRLDESALKTWLGDTVHRELLEFTITALVTTPETARITVNATSEDTAMIVYAVTRALPSTLTDDLTFSTYETNPQSTTARIIGCDRSRFEIGLPDGCFENGHVAFDPKSGRKSTLPREIGYSTIAVSSLASGDLALVDEFRATWQRLGLTDTTQFDLIDRLFRGQGSLDRDEMTRALQSPAVAVWVSARPDAVRQLTEWALDDIAFATGPFTRVVQAMRSQTDRMGSLADSVRSAGFEAVNSGDVIRAGNALDVILPMVAPAKAQAAWADVQAIDPASLTWETRWKLLPRLVQQANATPTGLAAWLNVPSKKLTDFLALDLPRAYMLMALRSDRPSEDWPTVAGALDRHPSFAVSTLKPSHEEDHARVESLFESLVVSQPGRSWFEEVLASAEEFPKSLLNRIFTVQLEKGSTDPDRLIRMHGPALVEHFRGQPGLETLATRFLSAPPADLLQQTGLIDFLTHLKTTDDPELKPRIEAVRCVHEFLEVPNPERTGLRALAEALNLAPSPLPGTAKTSVFRAISDELARRVDSKDFQSDVEAVACELGNTLAKGPTDLFQDMLREWRAKTDFASNVNAVAATLGIALGAPTCEGTGFDGLEADAFAIAAASSKAGRQRMLDAIDARTAEWPKDAKAKWGFLKEAVRPPSSRWGRDFACFLFGAVSVTLAGGVWWAIKSFPTQP